MLKVQAGKDFCGKKVSNIKPASDTLMTFSCNWEILMWNYWEIDFCVCFLQDLSVVKSEFAEKLCFLVDLKSASFLERKKNSVHFFNPQCFGLPPELKTGMSTKSDKILSPKFKFLFHLWSKNRLSPPTQDSAKKGLHLTKILLTHF